MSIGRALLVVLAVLLVSATVGAAFGLLASLYWR
jgi:hypothetical protein